MTWVRMQPTQEQIETAIGIRTQRHNHFRGTGYEHKPGDMRWIGDLAPLLLRDWLAQQGVSVEWLRETRPSSPDFVIGNRRVDTRCRSAYRLDLRWGVSALDRHRRRNADLVFCVYETSTRDLVLVGAMDAFAFFDRAEQYQRDEIVHQGFRPRADSYELPILDLLDLHTWVRTLQ